MKNAGLMRQIVHVAGICVAAMASGVAAAEEKNSGAWTYELAPLYLWGVSVDGGATVKKLPFTPSVPLSVDFKDAVKDLSGIFTVYFEGRNPRWGYYANFSYLRLTPKSDLSTGGTVNIDFRNPFVEVAGLYRLGEAGRSPWWAVGGARYLGIDMTASGLPSPPLPTSSVGVKQDVIDLFGGVRFNQGINERWGAFAQADIGAGDSKRSWSATLYATYRVHKHAKLVGGWRWLDYKIRESSVDLDLRMSGPLLAVNFDW